MTVAHTEEGERTVSQSPTGNRAAATERAILAGGCFWGMEDLLRRARGVISTRVGYTGGEMPDPTYARHYGHAEAVEVTFDPSVLAYRSLLELFFQIHDPTTYEQQGSDVGPSYRSAIFYTTEVQKVVAEVLGLGHHEVVCRDVGHRLAEIDREIDAGVGGRCTAHGRCAGDSRIHAVDHEDLVALREPLDDLGPELDGDAVMELLGLTPGRDVGAALAYLQRLRLDDGLLGRDEVARRLGDWWAAR